MRITINFIVLLFVALTWVPTLLTYCFKSSSCQFFSLTLLENNRPYFLPTAKREHVFVVLLLFALYLFQNNGENKREKVKCFGSGWSKMRLLTYCLPVELGRALPHIGGFKNKNIVKYTTLILFICPLCPHNDGPCRDDYALD